MQAHLDELLALAIRHARDERITAIPRVSINLGHGPTQPLPGVVRPMLCLVLQGAKEVTVGDRLLRYDPACYFIASVELAASGRVTEASRERPYVSLSLALDPEALAALIPNVDDPARSETGVQGFGVSPVTADLVDAWLRLLSLLETPRDIRVLAPMLEREILYRLLQGPQAEVLRQVARADSRLSRVRRAIAWIRGHYDQQLRIAALAELAGMSPASLHRHFKAVTAMSPLQFQKSLRLQHARRLLMADQDAARAGYAVGYESASQFSREYARLFGAPPVRDAMRLRGDAAALAEVVDGA
ncbi:AraC family transcriptional regulator [Phenylobacterium hankyongense]|uniref:AraC family transcriptional regulator n=1 Tax=Phenylobacterium hankyongense TaxID=1813876 RepID=A0A328B3L5_9CAUL|nr:AraC family transcriptional regulator [Phenylobacterium hankyongense]RAK61479.1 AraC family transcriptional regulator [Phenylobacterium hankyongense]